MQRPTIGDVIAAARVLRGVAEAERGGVLDGLIAEAGSGAFGGSLMAVALMRRPPPEPPLTDTDYCRALILVLEALVTLQRRRRDTSER